MDKNVTCNTTDGCSINGGPISACTGSFLPGANVGETASILASTTFGPLTVLGIYKYFFFYHLNIGWSGTWWCCPTRHTHLNPHS